MTWRSDATSYAVYRFDGAKADPRACDFADASHLVASVRGDDAGSAQSWTDTTAVPGAAYTYLVTALDRAYRESGRSAPAAVR